MTSNHLKFFAFPFPAEHYLMECWKNDPKIAYKLFYLSDVSRPYAVAAGNDSDGCERDPEIMLLHELNCSTIAHLVLSGLRHLNDNWVYKENSGVALAAFYYLATGDRNECVIFRQPKKFPKLTFCILDMGCTYRTQIQNLILNLQNWDDLQVLAYRLDGEEVINATPYVNQDEKFIDWHWRRMPVTLYADSQEKFDKAWKIIAGATWRDFEAGRLRFDGAGLSQWHYITRKDEIAWNLGNGGYSQFTYMEA